MIINIMYMYILLYSCTFALKATRGAAARRADDTVGLGVYALSSAYGIFL